MTQKLILTDITPLAKQKILNKIDFSIKDGRIFFHSLFIYNKDPSRIALTACIR
jgi:hypothetical protein